MAEAKEIKRYLLQQTKHNMGRIISRKYAFQGLYLSGDNSISHKYSLDALLRTNPFLKTKKQGKKLSQIK